MPKPGTEAMTGIVLHGAHFSNSAKCIGDALCCAFVICRKAYAHVAIAENGIIWPIGLLDLIERLRDEETLETIACHEGECAFEEVEPSEGWKLIEHQQHTVSLTLGLQVLGQTSADLIEDQADERFCPRDVGWRHDEIEGGWPFAADQFTNAPVTAPRHCGNDRIAVEAKKRHGG